MAAMLGSSWVKWVALGLLWIGVESVTSGPYSTMTTAVNPGTVYGTPTNRQVTITARTSASAAVGVGGDVFLAELFTNNATCNTVLSTYTCMVSCSPYNSPNTASKLCLSSTRIEAPSGPHWVDGVVTDNADGTYTVIYNPEYAGMYDLKVGLAVVGGLRGLYYDNLWFLNDPVISRIDPSINFNWGTGPLTTYGVDYVSIRWEGKLRPDYTQRYTLYAFADDGIRVWFDRRLVIDKWDKCCNETWANVDLTSGIFHDLKIDYKEMRGSASVQLFWSAPSVAKEIIPASNLYSVDEIVGSPVQGIYIGPGNPPDASKTTASGAGLQTAVAGTVASFKVIARDPFGNLLTANATSSVWTVGPSGAGAASGHIDHFSGANYNGSWSTTVTGTYSVDVRLNAVSIANSPWTVVVAPAVTSAATSTASGAGLTVATTGVSATFIVQAKDVYANNRDTAGDDLRVTLSGTSAPSAGFAYIGSGQYQVYYTPTTSGSLTVVVKIGATSISGSPFTVTVAVGAVHAATCSATLSSNATSGAQSTIVISAKDAFGNLLTAGGIGTFGLALTGPAVLVHDSIAYSGSGGLYNALYTPTKAGTYSIAITLGGVAIAGSPFKVNASPGSASPSTSSAIVTDGTSGVLAIFQVTVRDAYSNLVTVNTSSVTGQLSCGSVSTTNSTFMGNGLYVLQFTPTTKGNACLMRVYVGFIEIGSSPYTIAILPGQPASTTSSVSGTGISAGVTGVRRTLSIALFDSNSNALVVGGNLVVVNVTDADNQQVPVIILDYGTGSYQASFTPTKTGAHAVSVKLAAVGGLDAVYYSDSVLAVVQTSASVETTLNHDWGYVPAKTGLPADQFSVRWSGKIRADFSETYRITVALYANTGVRIYLNGNIFLNAWNYMTGNGNVFADFSFVANVFYDIVVEFRAGTGQARCQLYWSHDSSPEIIIVPSTNLYFLRDVASSPFTGLVMTPATVNASLIVASAPMLNSLSIVSATVANITLTVHDNYGNIYTSGGAETFLTAHLTNVNSATIINAVVTDLHSGDGRYSVVFTPIVAGPYVFFIKYNGIHIAGSPWTVMVGVGPPSATNTLKSGLGLTTATSGVQSFFSLTVYDSSLNLRGIGGDSWTITMVSGSNSVIISVSDNHDGTYSCNYTATVAASYTLSISLNGVSTGSPSTVFVAAAAAVPITSAIRSGLTAPISAVQSTFTISTADTLGNWLTVGGYFHYVTLLSYLAVTTRANVSDIGNGNYTATYVVPSVGTYQLSVQLAAGSGSGSGDGLLGSYYHNSWLEDPAIFTRVDKHIDFQWGTDLITMTARDYISIRWTGFVAPLYAEEYTFYTDVDNQARLYVDGVLLIDAWASPAGESNGTIGIHYAPNHLYSVKFEFRKTTGNAQATLRWSSPSQAKEVIPQSQLFSQVSHIVGSPFMLTVVS